MDPLLQSVITAVFSGILVALATWHLNRKLESFKHDLIHKVNARKILIEKELEFYAKLFEVLTDLRSLMAELTNPVIRELPGETMLSRNQSMHARILEPFNKLYTLSWSYRPFYPDSLYPRVDELRKLTHRCLVQIEGLCQNMIENRRDNHCDPDRWRDAQNAAKKIEETTEALIGDVRARIDKMS